VSADRTVIGIDTAMPDVAVALTRGGRALVEESIRPGAERRPRAATELLPAVHRCVARAGGWDRIDRLAVGTGPGSFTGLRIGVATARALAQALGKPIVGVVSLRALALGLGGRHPDRPRLPLIDARRGQVFGALYDGSAGELWEPFVASPEEAAARLGELAAPAIAFGDGSVRFRQTFEAAGAEVPGDGNDAHRLAARHVCALAEGGGATRLEAVEPIYLRPPDAELWRERQRSTSGG
jgi:tRNA threonylcarbamoyladenosine biosynthesis protein TsaB